MDGTLNRCHEILRIIQKVKAMLNINILFERNTTNSISSRLPTNLSLEIYRYWPSIDCKSLDYTWRCSNRLEYLNEIRYLAHLVFSELMPSIMTRDLWVLRSSSLIEFSIELDFCYLVILLQIPRWHIVLLRVFRL